jgi:hypothetical protein
MTVAQPEVRPPFDDLLAELKRRRFNVGVEQRLRLLWLLEKLAGNCEPEQLRTLLCPIFATNETEQTEFYKIFDSLYSLFQVADPNRSKPMGEVRREMKASRQIRYFLPVVIGFAVTIMILGSQVFVHTINRKSSPEPKPKGDGTLLPSPPDGPPILKPPITNPPGTRLSLSLLVTPTPQPPNPGFSEALAEYRNEFHWAAVLIPCLGFLTWEMIRRRRRNPVLDRTRGSAPPFSWELDIRLPPLPDYNSRQFFTLARKLRRRRSSEIQRFDIALTVASTIRALGFPRFRFRADTRRKQGKRLKNALGQIPQAEIARDYVLLRLLEKTPASRLSLILPHFLRRLAFENAVPLFGLSTLMRAVVTLAMIGLAWFSIEKFAKTAPDRTRTEPAPPPSNRP